MQTIATETTTAASTIFKTSFTGTVGKFSYGTVYCTKLPQIEN